MLESVDPSVRELRSNECSNKTNDHTTCHTESNASHLFLRFWLTLGKTFFLLRTNGFKASVARSQDHAQGDSGKKGKSRATERKDDSVTEASHDRHFHPSLAGKQRARSVSPTVEWIFKVYSGGAGSWYLLWKSITSRPRIASRSMLVTVETSSAINHLFHRVCNAGCEKSSAENWNVHHWHTF